MEQTKTMWTGYVWSAIKHLDDGFVMVTFKPQPRRDISFKIKRDDLTDLAGTLASREYGDGGSLTLFNDGTLCVDDPKDLDTSLCEIKTYGSVYEGRTIKGEDNGRD